MHKCVRHSHEGRSEPEAAATLSDSIRGVGRNLKTPPTVFNGHATTQQTSSRPTDGA